MPGIRRRDLTDGDRRGVGLAVTVAAAGGLLFGYDTGVISGALLLMKPEFGLEELGEQVVVASLLAGALVGAVAGGATSDALGRRKTLLGVSMVFLLGALLSALAPNVTHDGGGADRARVVDRGVAPKQRRGRLVPMNQFLISAGILVSYLVNYAFEPTQGWRWARPRPRCPPSRCSSA